MCIRDSYTAVTSPKLSGYKAEILSTNVPGLKAGDNAVSVAASYTYSPVSYTHLDVYKRQV